MHHPPPPLPKSFICLPRDLLIGTKYSNLSVDAKMIYAILLNRAQSSAKKKWFNADGDCYIYCTLEEIQSLLGCRHGKATATLRELEQYRLIRRRAQGQGKPHQIIVLPYDTLAKTNDVVQPSRLQSGGLDCRIAAGNKTDIDKSNDRSTTTAIIRDTICVDGSLDDLPADRLDVVFRVLADTICDPAETIMVGQRAITYDVMRKCILALDAQQIRCLYYDWVYRHPTATDPHDCILAYLASTI